MPKFWSRYGPSLVVLLTTLAFTTLILAMNQWDPMTFVRLGTRYSQGDPEGTIGYDGQFAYQIALNPLAAAPYLDVPPYRYQRILYPLLARLVAFGQATLIPWALIGVNVAALTAGTYIMGLILARQRLSRWYGLTAALFVGQLVSLRLDVNEPLSLTLSLAGIYAFEKKQFRWGAFFLALSLLAKETALAFVGGYLAYFLLTRRWRTLIDVGLISLGPFALLQVILWITLGQFGIRSGGAGATPFSLIPFGGLLAFGLDNIETLIAVLVILGPLIVIPCVALTVSLMRHWRQLRLSPTDIILALHILMMATLPFSTYVDLPGVLRLTSGLVVATLVYAATIRSGKMLRYALFWLGSIPLLIFIG